MKNPRKDIDGPTFTGFVSQEKCLPSKIPGGWVAVTAMQSKEKSKLVGHAM
jgi:hypothetical protein